MELHAADDMFSEMGFKDLASQVADEDSISLTPAQYFGAIRIASAYRAIRMRNTLEKRQKEFELKLLEKESKKKEESESKKEKDVDSKKAD